MSEEPEGADFDPVGGFKAGERLPEKPFPASFYGYAPAFHEKNDAEWSAPEPLPKPPSAAEVSQYLSRTAPAPAVAESQAPLAVVNPFESELDDQVDPDARMKSVWSANTTDIDVRSFRTLTTPGPSARAPSFHLQAPPPSRMRAQPRAPSFSGTLASLVPFEGIPVPPITPRAPPSRHNSVRSITSEPFPVNPNAPVRSNSVGSTSSTGSGRSIRKSPFPTAPISRSNTSLSRDSGYPQSSLGSASVSDAQSSIVGRYLTPSPTHDVDVPTSARQSAVSSVGGDYQVAGQRRETMGVGSPLVEEVPRNLFVANQL